jgi:hypothetical protein
VIVYLSTSINSLALLRNVENVRTINQSTTALLAVLQYSGLLGDMDDEDESEHG